MGRSCLRSVNPSPDVGGASPFTPFTPLTSAPRLHDPLGFLQVALSYIVRVVWANAANPARPSFYSNPEEVFDLPDVDAVVISTTTNTHAPLTIKAIEKGKVSGRPAVLALCRCVGVR